ncbi:adenosylmethionine--8-amino-7-oxononanoate transaminase [Colwellia psychrerythraea]|uniref:Adenosylmethionine-8-amino-7-oxononanoate aminotransferase n=1 Tax=Colwellia psychrerythraea TaxID=28229 RepID=A0A099KVN2_COLPS|nr:adenosylmethionine--8-amino-7-oxononanoate transaminase [Colwellia psychrerythraea]KGJ93713.1 adenosylmethionine--8-amino-7-oxononanoate aminotransferase [Colwellia psychrerythraea]
MHNKHTDLTPSEQNSLLLFDKENVWHPYTSMSEPLPSYLVDSANGVTINLASGEELIDGMSSWWSVLHGYNHPALNKALQEQSAKMSHVMFGGLTHKSAITLCEKLISLTPDGLDKVFLSDSGSVSVEVAMKMALQYQHAVAEKKKTPLTKTKLFTVKNGYHGDTFAAMSVCDPVTGMHQIFEQVLMQHYFAPAPSIKFGDKWSNNDITELSALFEQHHNEIAAFIIEPIVQGTGGMRFYHPEYLKACRLLCDKYDVLLIADEIATGFGRTGKLFACEWSGITPDIMCLGKTLTGGYITLAATLCSSHIAQTISEGAAGCFMHGPTFMGNALACAVANASIDLLLANDWQSQVHAIEETLVEHITPLNKHVRVKDTRVLGSIGAIECKQSVNVAQIQKRFVELGVWIRPFGPLIYIIPPLIINTEQLKTLVNAMATVLDEDECFNLINE